MSAEYNLQLIRDMYVALNAQDLDAHDQYWHEDMIWHGPRAYGDIHGLDGFKNMLRSIYEAFPDYHVEDEIQVADETWASATGFLTGHQEGEFMNIPPTGRPVKMRYSDFWLIRDGKLAENWVMTDDVGLFRQLGLEIPGVMSRQ